RIQRQGRRRNSTRRSWWNAWRNATGHDVTSQIARTSNSSDTSAYSSMILFHGITSAPRCLPFPWLTAKQLLMSFRRLPSFSSFIFVLLRLRQSYHHYEFEILFRNSF